MQTCTVPVAVTLIKTWGLGDARRMVTRDGCISLDVKHASNSCLNLLITDAQ